MYVDRAGDSLPLVLLLHGSILPGWRTWNAQPPLAEHYRLVVPHRSGYPPNPPVDRIDFEPQAREIAELIEPGHTLSATRTAVSLPCLLRPLLAGECDR